MEDSINDNFFFFLRVVYRLSLSVFAIEFTRIVGIEFYFILYFFIIIYLSVDAVIYEHGLILPTTEHRVTR